MYTFNVNMKSVVIHANRLEKLRKSALPNAIRGTLNSMAFDVKQKTMPVSANKHFTTRKPNFFKANSKVFMARGTDVKTMRSVVAFTPITASYNNEAVRELEQQEYSGVIDKRSFIPTTQARSGQVNQGQVLPSNRLRTIKNIVFSTKSRGRNKQEQFIRAAIKAGKNGFVVGNVGATQSLFKILSVKKDGGQTMVRKKLLYSYKSGRSVKIKKATHFMQEASRITHEKVRRFFLLEARRQYNRVFKK